jgi:hypothetical protein
MSRRSEPELRVEVVEVVTGFCFDRAGEVVVIPEGTRLRADDPLVERFPPAWFVPLRVSAP